jgi:hypothetical protein
LENTEENCEMKGKIWKKSKLNSEKIWKIQKTIVKRYEKYGWNVKWYGRKVSWKVKRYEKYGKKASCIEKWYGKYGRFLC